MTRLPLSIAVVVLAASADAQRFRFTNVTQAAGLGGVNVQPGGPGMAVGDFDGDGWYDLSISGSSDARPRLFWNNGARVTAGFPEPWFLEVSDRLPDDRVPSSLAMFADLDNDSDPDLVVVERGYDAVNDEWKTNWTGLACFENVAGSFSRLATDPVLGFAKKKNGGLALGDCDLDGDLDIVFTHSSPGSLNDPGSPAFYVRNDGMTFVDDTQTFGALGSTRYFSCVLADFNGDMKPDLHCAVDFFKDVHAHWSAPGVYTKVSDATGANNLGSDMGLAIGDIENDGDLDIYSTNIASAVLYVNDGAGSFSQEQSQRGVNQWPGFPVGWGTAFVDFDLDMDEDLVFVAAKNPGLIYSNDGNGYFTNQTATSGLYLLGHGLVPFDFDRDGDVDFIMWRSVNSRPRLYRNDTFGNQGKNWLVVRARGSGDTPRDGVGARVRVTVDGVTQTRHILAGYSFKAGPPMEAHFGLGHNTVVDRIEVTWPDGDVQVVPGVTTNQVVTIVEP